MALLSINFHSLTLGKHHSFKVILPEDDSQFDASGQAHPLKTMLLLHGLSNDDSLYTRYTNIERFANKELLAVIMPSADHSFYTNMSHGRSEERRVGKSVKQEGRRKSKKKNHTSEDAKQSAKQMMRA